MEKRLNKMLVLWKDEHVLYLKISFSMALFILFFQPFSSPFIDVPYDWMTPLVFGGIVLLTMLLVRTVCYILGEGKTRSRKTASSVFKMGGIVIWLVSFAICMLYLVYVELLSLSFYMVLKVAFICLAPPFILMISGKMRDLKQNNEMLLIQGKLLRYKMDHLQEKDSNTSIEFKSKNGSGNFSLLMETVLYAKSADNYTEIHYLEGTHHKKKLLRNTLRNIESEMKAYPQFIRCHRTCIVNINCVEKFDSNCSTHNLTLKGYDQIIPVSRQYVSKIKEAL